MSTPKYIVYQCGVCKRETEILLDARRPDPVRCNITLNCRGKLQKTGERASKGFLFTPIVPGLDDYVPRGTDLTVVPVLKAESPISIFTGRSTMTAALVQHETVGNVSNFYVYDQNGNQVVVETRTSNFTNFVNAYMNLYVYEVTPSMMKYRKYIYEAPNGIQLLRGLDHSHEGRNLRFSADDVVKVFSNGVELTSDRFDRSTPNEIILTPAETTPNSILEVYVYDELQVTVPEEDLIPLKFRPLGTSQDELNFRDQNSWGDFFAVEIAGFRRLLMYCIDTTELDTNKTYGVVRAEMVPAAVGSAPIQIRSRDLYLLLGKEPFMFHDKELHAFVNGPNLLSSSTLLNYRQSTASGEFELVIDHALIDQVYHPISPLAPVPRVTDQHEREGQTVHGTEELKRKYILGPS